LLDVGCRYSTNRRQVSGQTRWTEGALWQRASVGILSS